MSKYALLKNRRNEVRGNDLNAFNVLTVLVGELELISKRTGREPTDEDVTSLAKKFTAANNEVISVTVKDEVKENLIKENKALEEFIPAQLSDSELRRLYVQSESKDVKEFMGFLKSHYSGKYDGKKASMIAQQFKEVRESLE